ncbi:hypothetical protein BgiMline_033700, partial [Biomphalaria glabrata]
TIKVFTDGSTKEVQEGRTNSGYGAVFSFPGKTENDELVGPCAGQSDYIAKMEEIKNALEHNKRQIEEGTAAPANVTLFTDSLSCLQALESPETRPTQLAKPMACVEHLKRKYQ